PGSWVAADLAVAVVRGVAAASVVAAASAALAAVPLAVAGRVGVGEQRPSCASDRILTVAAT
ncbi:MAG: hypothetical protein WBL66_11370, partial [Candidatus Acidiferrales bacterium]